MTDNKHLTLRQDTQQLIRDLAQKEPFNTNMNERKALKLLKQWLELDNKE